MKRTRFLSWLIVILTIFAVFVNLPQNIAQPTTFVLDFLHIKKPLEFRKGLDLEGGSSLSYRADTSNIAQRRRKDALDSTRTVIERRINLFGVSEPVVQTAVVGDDYRLLVELPGVADLDAAKKIIGTTAQLSFWEQGATSSALQNVSSPSALPIGITQILSTNPKKTNLSGTDLRESSVSFDPNTGKPQVQLNFTSSGSQKFADITKRNVGKIVAIVLDNQVIEAPRVNEPILTGNAVITGSFTTQQAKQLSIQLNAGALPVSLKLLEEKVVGPTLGISSLQKSLLGGVLGFVAIVLFMSILYARLGILASVALVLYSLFVLAVFKLSSLTPYGITLTLSGIAGFILSIGMAVDANILIFERIKEEERNGRKRHESIEIGFSKAWPSIRDSNSATLITCFILYQFGTGMVKGFALVLGFGVIISMFSAIVVTRTFLRLLYRA